MDKTDLRDIRRANLKKLIDEQFNGNQADFAKSAKRNPTQVNHWMSGHRNPNGDTCRSVETELKLGSGWLDQPHTDASVNVTGVQAPASVGQVTATGSIQDVPDSALVAEFARRIKEIPREQREPLRNEVAALVMSPDSEETRAALTHFLTYGDERLPTTTTEMIEKNREKHAAKSVTNKDSVRS